ncbi:hypothetical protein GF394_00870 [Candidatus Fermentibacteria bacterium]|nr:hypothetical protein [Candidatus Fermentibacteria bacterium]
MSGRTTGRGSREIAAKEQENESILRWVSHPARERPGATVAYVAIILIAGVLAAAVMDNNLWWGMLGVMVLLLSGWTFFLPVTFEMDGEGVKKKSIFGTEEKKWNQVKSIVPDRYGVLLSPFPQPTRLAKFRGLSVQFSNNREEVLEYIRSHTTGQS